MRKILWFMLLATPTFSQVSNPSIIPVTVAPSGSCTAGLPNQQVVTTGIQYSCQNGTWAAFSAGGSGTVNSGTANQIGYYAGAGSAISGNSLLLNTTTDSIYAALALPTVTGSVSNNVVLGTGGAGSHLAPGAGAVGGQYNVIMGYAACPNATSMRESVCIGNAAGNAITGNGSGPDDMIGVYIGSYAASHLTNAGGANVIIGQKAFTSATNSASATVVGIHAGSNLVSDTNGAYFGATVYGDKTVTSATNMTGIGGRAFSGIAVNSTVSDDTCVGYNCMSGIDGTGSTTGSQNTGIGSQIGSRLGKGNLNFLAGYQVGSIGAGTITGTRNVLIGDGNTALRLTSGSDNFVVDEAAQNLTTGSYNLMWGNGQTGGLISTGTDNIILGEFANQNGGNLTKAVLIGYGAGFSATANSMVAMGDRAGQYYTAAGGTFLGSHAGVVSGGGSGVTSGANVTAVGDTSCFSATTGSNLECFGQNADIAAALSNAAEIGTGQNTVANTLAFHGKSFVNTSGTIIAPLWQPSTLYSAAGTPLPTCNAGAKGTMAVVSDATTPTYNGTYTSGGAVTVPVLCDGTNWTTH